MHILINEEIIQAFLNCETKSHFKLSHVVGSELEFSDWQECQIVDFNQICYHQFQAGLGEDEYVISVPLSQIPDNNKYHLLIDCVVETQEMWSRIHALERIPFINKKQSPYIPIRCVPTEKITKHNKLLLAFDALVLFTATGKMPLYGKIVHGYERKTTKVQLAELFKTVQIVIAKIIKQQTNQIVPQLILNKHCPECEYQSQCRQKAIEADDLSLLAGIAEKERKRQHSKGIFTVTQISYTFRPRRRPKRLVSKANKYQLALKALAIREHKIHITGKPELSLIENPVYLDVEGDPDRNFYYLIGLRIKNGDTYAQYSFWADFIEDERDIWISCLQLLSKIENPQLIYYGGYETTFLRRMKERYSDTLENTTIVEQLIKKSINLLSVIYGQIYFPTYSNSLKEIARCLGFQWSDNSASGLKALMWRSKWEASRDSNLKGILISYNSDDCVALEKVTRAVDQLCQQQIDATKPNDSDIIYTESFKRDGLYRFGLREFANPEFQYINQAAYWDYQRKKIYSRSSKQSKHKVTRSTRKRIKTVFVNQVIECRVPDHCPLCDAVQIVQRQRMSRLVYDLKFGRTSVKRWIIRYKFHRYLCEQCGAKFHYTPRPWTGGIYGPNMLSYMIYQLVELRLSLTVVAQHISELFAIGISRFDVIRQKSKVAQLYKDTYEGILKKIIGGSLIHADETGAGIKREGSYVWILANSEEVVYFYAQTREGDLVQNKLKGFNGVLVSDFYAAYDSIQCPQQKCLIHLLRDLDDDLHKQPFNEELKELVNQFAGLLRLIIDTIDRFGLKARYLRKHKISVKRFYKWLSKQNHQSEVAIKYGKRFEKNRGKLFTFLDYDGIPWNNNNAEHAVKAFARLRSSLHGTSTENGLSDYLILLSIYETCKYKGVSFLDFLRSGEKDIDVFAQRNTRKSKQIDLAYLLSE